MSETNQQAQDRLFRELSPVTAAQSDLVAQHLDNNPVVQNVSKEFIGIENDEAVYREVNGLVDLTPYRAAVQREIDLLNTIIFSDDTIERENALRSWIRSIAKASYLNISDAEALLEEAKKHRPGQIFDMFGVTFIVTTLCTLDRLDRYIHMLEATIINNQTVVTAATQTVLTNANLTFLDLIKLAFNKLLNRSK